MTSGGSALAVQTVEREYICGGNDHLRDDISLNKIRKMSCCTACCWGCLEFIITVALIYFTVMYFVLTNDPVKMKDL